MNFTPLKARKSGRRAHTCDREIKDYVDLSGPLGLCRAAKSVNCMDLH